ncbi:uncharacterized protein EV422DRAFT_496415 [Fimicolochytrium jonesii]|uniref:uncharacterized protein n=1 Tax=Fimicolochytrium jonesii TaxID=1396493 RepID=UPI0022FEF75E|nr:uncharacterized protein EV422DRAFT_496415 [Fimicolochytrium jonesii]KAI8820636.1 hypothetical protein EV422DRAFT_496415 [Fimicolochytrium jonesii]
MYAPYGSSGEQGSRGGRGRGRGRGQYYREKYGGRGGGPSNARGGPQDDRPESSVSAAVNNSNNGQALAQHLRSLDRAPYGAYKDVRGSYLFESGLTLFVDHVQSDPFAPPSKIRVRLPQQVARFPPELFGTRIRRVALEDYITRRTTSLIRQQELSTPNASGGNWHGTRADIRIDIPGQQVIERSSCTVTAEYVEVRITVGLPAQGRSIMGHQAAELLTVTIPNLADRSVRFTALDANDISNFVGCVEDQGNLRRQIVAAGLIAFVVDGAVLPRESGASDLPMRSQNVVAFRSPPSLIRSFTLPNRGVVKGMGIPKGITLIVGGGFHGKSTLLDALQNGVYNHIPGDGREFVVTDDTVSKIKAEDGRSVTSVDISPFINNLPFESDTSCWSSEAASGSTSMAANLQEALETGSRGVLLDEDSCATNFLIRDQRMSRLVTREKEPITPFISKIRSLYLEKHCSSILVIGGCGSYIDVADLVISLDSYVPKDVTSEARHIAASLPDDSFHYSVPTIPGNLEQLSSNSSTPRPRKSKALNTFLISIDGVDVDLSALEQLVHPSQSRAIVTAMLHIRSKPSSKLTLNEWMDAIEAEWDANGLPCLSDWITGDLARPRRFELAGAINRLRGVAIQQTR